MNLLTRSYFLHLIIYKMKSLKLAVSLLVLLVVVTSQNTAANTANFPFNIQPANKGLTFQATVFPSYESSWAGRFSCNNCNPFEGDQPCSKALPIVCIVHHKTIVRPRYRIAIQHTPFAVQDGGYYDSWTGGVFATTLPVRGSDISSYEVGNNLCKGYFGTNAKFAEFDDGFYMPVMSQPPEKTYALWDWNKAKRGAWNMWGFFNHHYRGRAWVWIRNQPNGNCGN